MTAILRTAARDAALSVLARFLVGDGIELGPGHQPFPLPHPATNVRYVDRWKPDENLRLFPELGDGVVFPVPDIVADLNVEGLSMLPDDSEDFVIARHRAPRRPRLPNSARRTVCCGPVGSRLSCYLIVATRSTVPAARRRSRTLCRP